MADVSVSEILDLGYPTILIVRKDHDLPAIPVLATAAGNSAFLTSDLVLVGNLQDGYRVAKDRHGNWQNRHLYLVDEVIPIETERAAVGRLLAMGEDLDGH